ncbi:hypothetical protein K449DRAFT_387875 [Hypoxylon sp. EC38]|nr:hypothetical protein K449DRAFT_387875 [Hypoxylon sp. EC38]
MSVAHRRGLLASCSNVSILGIVCGTTAWFRTVEPIGYSEYVQKRVSDARAKKEQLLVVGKLCLVRYSYPTHPMVQVIPPLSHVRST